MNSSPIEKDHIRQPEPIAIFGAALLVKRLDGRFGTIGGTEGERQQLREWAETFLNNGSDLRWCQNT
jgi:hypothetical protein